MRRVCTCVCTYPHMHVHFVHVHVHMAYISVHAAKVVVLRVRSVHACSGPACVHCAHTHTRHCTAHLHGAHRKKKCFSMDARLACARRWSLTRTLARDTQGASMVMGHENFWDKMSSDCDWGMRVVSLFVGRVYLVSLSTSCSLARSLSPSLALWRRRRSARPRRRFPPTMTTMTTMTMRRRMMPRRSYKS
jgi:hypothetical protein